MTGTGVIVVLLVPILFQIVYHNIISKKRHEEIIGRLEKLEKDLNKNND